MLALKRSIVITYKIGRKFTPKWDEPYVVREIYTNGAYKIVDGQGVRVEPTNDKFLKRYFP